MEPRQEQAEQWGPPVLSSLGHLPSPASLPTALVLDLGVRRVGVADLQVCRASFPLQEPVSSKQLLSGVGMMLSEASDV